MSSVKRPLSPHLSVYRPQITSVLSIMHRMTGVALYVGMALFIVFLSVVAYCPESYVDLRNCLASPVGQLFLFGWTLAFYFHFCNGIRHLFWDMGKGLDVGSANKSGWLVVVFSLGLTVLSWAIAYHNTGAL